MYSAQHPESLCSVPVKLFPHLRLLCNHHHHNVAMAYKNPVKHKILVQMGSNGALISP
jgi:hypothetical protein